MTYWTNEKVLVLYTKNEKMADHDAVPVVTDKSKKCGKNGSKQEQAKKQKLSPHFTGPD